MTSRRKGSGLGDQARFLLLLEAVKPPGAIVRIVRKLPFMSERSIYLRDQADKLSWHARRVVDRVVLPPFPPCREVWAFSPVGVAFGRSEIPRQASPALLLRLAKILPYACKAGASARQLHVRQAGRDSPHSL